MTKLRLRFDSAGWWVVTRERIHEINLTGVIYPLHVPGGVLGPFPTATHAWKWCRR